MLPLSLPCHVKLLIITDTHGSIVRWKDQIPSDFSGYDACLILGDVTGGDIPFINSVIAPNVKCFGILGNHDEWGAYEGTQIEDVNEKVFTLPCGLRIGAMSGSIRYKNGNWPMLTDEEASEKLKRMDECDILMTHDGRKDPQKDQAHSGLSGILEYLERYRVPLHVYGHKHEPKEECLPNGTRSICFYGITTFEA